jgi:hypothetical protein
MKFHFSMSAGRRHATVRDCKKFAVQIEGNNFADPGGAAKSSGRPPDRGRAVHREDIEFTKNIQGYSLLSKVVHPSDFSSCSHDRERRLAAMY